MKQLKMELSIFDGSDIHVVSKTIPLSELSNITDYWAGEKLVRMLNEIDDELNKAMSDDLDNQ